MSDAPVLELKGIQQSFPEAGGGRLDVIKSADLALYPGEMVALLGPSGSGKSTVLSLVAGILRPSAGRILVGPHELNRLGARQVAELRGRAVGADG